MVAWLLFNYVLILVCVSVMIKYWIWPRRKHAKVNL
jgi:hypothetical protein